MTDTPESVARRIIAPLREAQNTPYGRSNKDACDAAEREIEAALREAVGWMQGSANTIPPRTEGGNTTHPLPSEEEVAQTIVRGLELNGDAGYGLSSYELAGTARAVLALFKKPK